MFSEAISSRLRRWRLSSSSIASPTSGSAVSTKPIVFKRSPYILHLSLLKIICSAVYVPQYFTKLYPIPFKMAIDDLQAHNGWRKAITYVPDS